jgi:hypothetical protein
MNSETHTGTVLSDLIVGGERVKQQHDAADLYERVDQVLEMSRLYRESFAVRVLEESMKHLTDARENSRYPDFDSGDRAAWERLEGIRNWFVEGPLCCCGAHRNAHPNFGLFCPKPAGSRGLYLSTRFREQRCEASIPLSADGCHAIPCGEELLPGCEFCKEHMQ